jgi:hypothetical protein
MLDNKYVFDNRLLSIKDRFMSTIFLSIPNFLSYAREMTVASEEDKQKNIFEQIERSRNRRSWNMPGLFRKSVTLVSVMVSTPLVRTTGLVDTMKMAVTMPYAS